MLGSLWPVEIPLFHWEDRCSDVTPACRSSVRAGWRSDGCDLQWGTDLMEEAGCIWQVKTMGDESDAREQNSAVEGG